MIVAHEALVYELETCIRRPESFDYNVQRALSKAHGNSDPNPLFELDVLQDL